jgi:hypothetical protein
MRIVSRTARNVREQEREESLRKREAAGTCARGANTFPLFRGPRVLLVRVPSRRL